MQSKLLLSSLLICMHNIDICISHNLDTLQEFFFTLFLWHRVAPYIRHTGGHLWHFITKQCLEAHLHVSRLSDSITASTLFFHDLMPWFAANFIVKHVDLHTQKTKQFWDCSMGAKIRRKAKHQTISYLSSLITNVYTQNNTLLVSSICIYAACNQDSRRCDGTWMSSIWAKW